MEKCIVDVGTSHNAPRGIELKQQYNCPVIFIEPDINALNQVPSQKDDIKINCAITSYDGEINFNYYQDGTHSVLETNLDDISNFIDGYSATNAKPENWTAKKREKIKCYKLSTIIEQYKINKILYLKIDTQGHDFEVIKSLESYIDIVDFIECEVQVTDFEIYKNQSKKEDILKFMSEHKFKLLKTESQTYNQEENLYFKRE
jgi:FkbM family methyltransferase